MLSHLRIGPVIVTLTFGLLLPAFGRDQNTTGYLITTVVGTGNEGSGGDGGPAVDADLWFPTSVAIDPANHCLYLSDWNARIRRVNLDTGSIAPYAGTGQRGFFGDGGPAAKAVLGGSGSLAVDHTGNVYFADENNNRVRRIDAATGIIDTVAGNGYIADIGTAGLATAIPIGLPGGVAVDAADNFYVSNGADGVRRMVEATGLIETAAGAGGSHFSGDGGKATLAQLDQPAGLALDAQGNLYIADRGDHRIRKVEFRSDVITTIAGSSTGADSGFMGLWVYEGGFSGDGGPAIDALLNDPNFVAVDGDGNIYIADTLNYRIRRVDAETGIIETIAGTGVDGFSGDDGPALDAKMGTPAGLAVDPAGRIYFDDEENNRIRVLIPARLRPPARGHASAESPER